jgi:hypothetical protein
MAHQGPAPPPPTTVEANYTRLTEAVRSAVQGPKRQAPRTIAAGLTAFKSVADGFLDTGGWFGDFDERGPAVRTAIQYFLLTPSRARAKRSCQVLPDPPDAERWMWANEKWVCFFIVKAALEIAGDEMAKAASHARRAWLEQEAIISWDDETARNMSKSKNRPRMPPPAYMQPGNPAWDGWNMGQQLTNDMGALHDKWVRWRLRRSHEPKAARDPRDYLLACSKALADLTWPSLDTSDPIATETPRRVHIQ